MRIITAISLLVILFCGAIGWITHIDWERYRPELAAQISDALRADVQLNGRLSITFFPYPKLSAEDAELTASGIHIQMPHLRLTAKLWPLLRGRVILSSAYIINPKIAINPALWQPPRMSVDSASRTKVRLEDVEIKSGELDITLGENHELLTDIDLQLRAPDWHGPYQATSDFIWHDQEFEFTSQLGIKTAAGTRPANFTLHQVDGPHQFSWAGAVRPVPLDMRGDGEWHSAVGKLALRAQVNMTNQIIEIARGMLFADDKTMGPVTGHFMVGSDVWQDLDADLTAAAPGWLAGLSLIHLDNIWHKFAAAGQLQFHLHDGALTNLQFHAPQMTAVFHHNRWHLWGQKASAALALWGHPDITAWPAELAAPFDVKLHENKAGFQIESLRLGKIQTRGALAAGQLQLQADALGWPVADSVDAWRNVLRDMDLRQFTLHARQWDLAPFTGGDSKLILMLNKNTDHLILQTPDLTITGDFNDDDFKGQLDCDNNHLMEIFHADCGSAKITSDGNKWQFRGIADTQWNGALDFAAQTWDMHMPFNHSEAVANGKLAQADWHMDVTNLGLSEFLQIFLPNAPKGDGDITAQLRVTPEKAEGDVTLNNLQLSALNLSLDNPQQPGKIGTLTAKINWEGNVLELEQLRTVGPDGTGHASVNLESAIWHGDWADPRGNNHVAIDGAADSAAAQRYRFTETPRP